MAGEEAPHLDAAVAGGWNLAAVELDYGLDVQADWLG